jgi:hypothetical protein
MHSQLAIFIATLFLCLGGCAAPNEGANTSALQPNVIDAGGTVELVVLNADSVDKLLVAGRWIVPDEVSGDRIRFEAPPIEGEYQIETVTDSIATNHGVLTVRPPNDPYLPVHLDQYEMSSVSLQNVVRFGNNPVVSSFSGSSQATLYFAGDTIIGHGVFDRFRSRLTDFRASGSDSWTHPRGSSGWTKQLSFRAGSFSLREEGESLVATASGCYALEEASASSQGGQAGGGSFDDRFVLAPPYRREHTAVIIFRKKN